MCCSSSPKYQKPPTPDLPSLYNQEQQLSQNWAPSNAALSSSLYNQYAPQYAQQNADIYSSTAPQYASTNNAILDSLRAMSPQEQQLADQSVRAGQSSRGNINGDANIGAEVMNRADYANNRLTQKIGQMSGIGGAAGGGAALGNSGSAMANGTNFFNPNIGPTGQQAGLSLYQGQTQNAQNQFQAQQAAAQNNPFMQALGVLGGVAKIAAPFV